jgi:hypothetical protein
MKRIIALTLLIFAGFFGIQAQEVTLGVQYTRSNPDIRQTNFKYDNSTDTVGATASVTSYKTKNIGFTGEASANFNLGDKTSQFYTGMGGLTLKARRDKNLQPFIKGLAGVVLTRVDNELANNSDVEGSFGFKASAGVDYKRFRILEVGYLQSKFRGDNQNYFVASTGINF